MATLIDLSKELDVLFHELSPMERKKAMRNTMLTLGRKVRRQAVSNLSSMNYTLSDGKPGTRAKVLKKAVRVKEFKRKVGFYVTVQGSNSSRNANHMNRWGNLKPAARWFETGTDVKTRKNRKGFRSNPWKKAPGPQPPRPFLGPAWEQTKSEVESTVGKVFEEKLKDIVKKHNG